MPNIILCKNDTVGVNKLREYRRSNQKWTIQRHWHHKSHKTKKNKRILIGVYAFHLSSNKLQKL